MGREVEPRGTALKDGLPASLESYFQALVGSLNTAKLIVPGLTLSALEGLESSVKDMLTTLQLEKSKRLKKKESTVS